MLREKTTRWAIGIALVISASVARGQAGGEASVRLKGVRVIQVTTSEKSPRPPAQPGSNGGSNDWRIVLMKRLVPPWSGHRVGRHALVEAAAESVRTQVQPRSCTGDANGVLEANRRSDLGSR